MIQAPSKEHLHILIADDHAVVRRGLKEILAEAHPIRKRKNWLTVAQVLRDRTRHLSRRNRATL